ncbi:hypothetical protein BH23CYA1_BH23CYA1_02680 [soil metagenome]
MELNKDVMQAVEALDYRVTVGDVAARAGLNIATAQQGLLTLASETQGHMQVSDTGEIAYEFPRNFQGILRNKYWQLRFRETLSKIWQVVFYIIRLSFGVMLLVSIAIIFIAIFALMIAASSQGGGDRDNRRGGFGGFGGGFFFFPSDIFWLFSPRYGRRRQAAYGARTAPARRPGEKLNFFEAIFSFLFGDGNPNIDLEERRWRTIGNVISNNGGAIAAEQVAPYLDDLGEGWDKEYEDYMLPVLSRFNGQPEVSPNGEMVYYFPELQVSAVQRGKATVSAYLKEVQRKFTEASANQVMISIGLGSLNIVGALVLRNMLQNFAAQGVALPVAAAFAQSIFWLLLAYGVAFLTVPLVRYYWLQRQNAKIEQRNQQRAERAETLNRLGPAFQEKLAFAHQFAEQKVLREEDSVYSTETDLIEQESDRADQIDAEWRRRLEGL